MTSTPPRNPNPNSGPPPLIRRNQLIASDHNEGQRSIDFPSLEMNANNNQNQSLIDFEKQLKSPELSEQVKYDLIFESDLSDEEKQRLRDTHIFDPELLVLGKKVGGTKRRKTKRRKYKKNIIKKRKTKKRKYKK